VIVEYMAAGRPVVSIDVGGAGEAIIDGSTGFLVAPGDFERMAERIVKLLGDAPVRKGMGQIGRSIALEKFSLRSQLARTEALYDALAAPPRAIASAVSGFRPISSLPDRRG
jgi:glycosyltransferase involved in cell wall biosynthesis